MSRTYQPNNKECQGRNLGENLDVNVSGALLLDGLSEMIGFGKYRSQLDKPMPEGMIDFFIPRLGNVTEQECQTAVEKIKNLHPSDLNALYELYKSCIESKEMFDDFIQQYILFLETCQGFDVLG